MDYNQIRRKTKEIGVGNVKIGKSAPISVQSMTNTDTLDACATINQIRELEKAGCDIVRLAVPKEEAAKTIKQAKNEGIKIPIVADIHFDYKIALECLRMGVDKIRINPGNIGAEWKVKEVAEACKSAGVPIRIGVNSGSLEKSILEKYGSPTAQALAESAFYHAEMLERFNFSDIVISIKASSVRENIMANRIVASNCDYPLHLGVTEAGDEFDGAIKSAIGIGSLLTDGMGDTIRVSLTASPVAEIPAARRILASLGLNPNGGIDIVSCPTCGRTKVDLIKLSSEFKKAISGINTNGKNIKVAIMGCAVNGPGEAKDADIGIAGGIGEVLLFRHGEIIGKVAEDRSIPALIEELKAIINE